MSTYIYLKNLIKDKHIASVTPTSSFGVERVCSKIDFNHGKVFVEYGPGTGVFTRYLLNKISQDSRLILIERNKNFVTLLQEIKDPRVQLFHDTAENVLKALELTHVRDADYILSGIPFSFFTVEIKNRILKNTHQALKEGGKFLAYQTFFQLPNHLQTHLHQFFKTVKTEYQLLNVPPMRLYEATK